MAETAASQAVAHNLFRARRTALQMLQDRGYYVPKAELEQTFQQFWEKHHGAPSRDMLTISVHKQHDPLARIFVFFPDEVKLNTKTIRLYVERMREEKVQCAIIVLQEELTAFAKKALAECRPKYIIEVFKEAELLVNITEHVLVPKHVLLSEDEKRQLLEKYKLRETQLPRMQVSDPVARYMGLKKGDVVKIIRPSETAGRYVTYRLVV